MTDDELREAIRYTASKSGFSERLIEKDYFCTLVLRELQPLFSMGLVFKGGTALSKVHASLYRLSEDLDFAISMPEGATRRERRERIEPVKSHLEGMRQHVVWMEEGTEVRGANESTHYVMECRYKSCLWVEETEVIRVEIGLREPVIRRAKETVAHSLLIHPLTGDPAVDPVEVTVMSRLEAYAEKIRAALCRPEAAIRDFYDLDHAFESETISESDDELRKLVECKLAVAETRPPDLSAERMRQLETQITTELQPVLREDDFQHFNLGRVVRRLRRFG